MQATEAEMYLTYSQTVRSQCGWSRLRKKREGGRSPVFDALAAGERQSLAVTQGSGRSKHIREQLPEGHKHPLLRGLMK